MSGGLALWASDDTEAIQAAINAGHAWATAFASNYRIYSPVGPGRFYGIGGPLVTGGQTLGNGQLTVPVNPEADNGILASFEGVDTGANTRHWNQTTPAMSGSTWVSFGVFASVAAQSASAAAAGTPAVISGPTGVNGYGTSAELFSNVTIRLKNLTVLTTHSSFGLTYGVLNAHGCARAILEDFSYGTVGTRERGDYNSPAGFASGYSIGIVMPANGNNAMCTWRRVICQGGYTVAVYATEHCTLEDSILLYCWSGLGLVGYFGDGGTSAVGALHAVHAGQLAVEGCVYQVNIIGPGSGGSGPMLHANLDTEGFNQFTETLTGGAHGVPSASALGVVRLSGANGPISTAYPTAMQIINDVQPPGPSRRPDSRLGTAQINTYWRWATVLLAGGAVTAVKVSALMGGATAPAMTTVWTGPLTAPISIRIPPGRLVGDRRLRRTHRELLDPGLTHPPDGPAPLGGAGLPTCGRLPTHWPARPRTSGPNPESWRAPGFGPHPTYPRADRSGHGRDQRPQGTRRNRLGWPPLAGRRRRGRGPRRARPGADPDPRRRFLHHRDPAGGIGRVAV